MFGAAEGRMKRAGELQTDKFPISLSLEGAPIGAAQGMEEEETGTFRLEGLDFIARVFFAERVGPGGPEDTRLCDLTVMDRARHRTMRAHVATVRSFSAGTGELEFQAAFADV
jgi:hypothetical protein